MQPVLPCGEAERFKCHTKLGKKINAIKISVQKDSQELVGSQVIDWCHPNVLDSDHLLVDGSLHPVT